MLSLTTSSSKETEALGASMGRILRGGEVLALHGTLGSGKTTFVRGLAQGLGVKRKITSPTFLLAKRYPLGHGRGFYHLDLYRLKTASELGELGIEEMLDRRHVVAIEWPAVARRLLPHGAIIIKFRADSRHPNKRQITLTHG